MMMRRSPALLALLLAACAHAPPVIVDALDAGIPRAPTPEEARARAASEPDPVAAIDTAWILGNDRALARQRLEAAVAQGKISPALLWRRARLAEVELRQADARADLVTLVAEHPASPEAALAIAQLSDSPGEGADDRARARDAAQRALLSAAALSPPRVAQLGLLFSRASASDDAPLDPAIAARTGQLLEARALGPLGPRALAALEVPTAPELEGVDAPAPDHRGRQAAPRAAFRQRGELSPVEGDADGLYLVEAYLVLRAAADVALTVDLRSAGRVRVDGAVVIDRSATSAFEPANDTVELALDAGAHRVTVALLATRADAVRVSALAPDGRPLDATWTAERPAAVAAPRPLVPKKVHSDLARALSACRPITREAPECVPDIAADPWSARAMLGELALARATRDVERARALVRLLAEAAPRSALALSLRARLSALESLPPSRADADLRRALTEDPTHPGLLLAVARQLEADEPEAAMALVDRARTAVPSAVEPELARFRLLRARGWMAEATAALEAVLGRSRAPSVLEEAARHHRTLVHLREARALEAELEAALPTDDRAIKQALARGEIEIVLNRVATRAPTAARPAEAWRLVADLRLGLAQAQPALEAADRALASEPSDTAAHRTALVAARALGDGARVEREIAALRALGAADLELEVWAAEVGGRAIGREPAGSWLAEKLAIDPRAAAAAPDAPDWSGAARVRLLDRVVDHVRADGSALSHHHELLRLRNKDAADMAGEISLPGGALPLSLRTLKPDGRAVEVDRHAGKSDLSFSALEPGDTVEQEFVAVTNPATHRGGYLRRFLFQSDAPCARAELAVVVPRGTPVWWKSYHGAPEPEVHEDADRTTYYFAARNISGLPAEPAMAPIEEFLPFVVVAVGLDDARAMAANRAVLGPIARPSRELTTLTASVTAGAAGPAEALERVVRWVEKHVREGSGDATRAILLGEGSQLGVITAMARAAGLDAALVLARSGQDARVAPPYPDPGAYGDVMARVSLPDGARWIDVAGPALTAGKAPTRFDGGRYIVIDPPGDPTPREFAASDLERWKVQSRAQLALDAAGTLTGTIRVVFPPMIAATVRPGFRPLRTEDIARGLQGWISGVLPGVDLVDVRLTDLAAPSSEEFALEVAVRGASVLGEEGGARVMRRFFEGPVGLRALGIQPLEAYLSRSQRVMPLALAAAAERLEVEVTLAPELGAPLDPPATFEKDSPWAKVSQRFTWDPATRVARLSLDSETRAVRVPPEAYPAFRAMAQEVTLRTRNRLILGR